MMHGMRGVVASIKFLAKVYKHISIKILDSSNKVFKLIDFPTSIPKGMVHRNS